MGGTPDDRAGGITDADLILLNDTGVDPVGVGEFTNNAGDLKGRDATGVFNLRSGAGLSEVAHKALRQLIHFIDDGPAGGFASGALLETLPLGDPFPTSWIWWESAGKTQKIVDLVITRNANKTPATETWKSYDTDGTTILETVTDTISYSGVIETSRTRAIA